MQIRYFLAGTTACLLALLLCKPVLSLCKRMHISQTIYHHVKEHESKSGTPTMGGIIFILAGIITYIFVSNGQDLYSWLSLVVMLAYGLIGFLDDFIKIRFRQNKGLTPLQKIIGQVAIAVIISLFVYFKVGTSLDFFGITLELGWGIIPFTIFVFLAITNSVNLTDGLDGLAGGVSAVYILFFGLILTLSTSVMTQNMSIVCFAMFGAIVGYLAINTFPAKIFMGDTGSLALGGFIACISIFSGKVLLMPIMGLMFVLSALSVVIQVLYYKRTKKRVFLMAPLHHHFQKKGVHENRIVTIYIIVSGLLSALCLCLEFAL